ncbi:MAG: prepilin peptidase, partial [Lachnospiraceae bacterium]|nr:prepilin peptidase [Lachnospiraceae bacterium]
MYIIVFLYGIVIGSFLNVCIYRIPRGEDIVRTSSHCMKCNHDLKWYDLFPIASFL